MYIAYVIYYIIILIKTVEKIYILLRYIIFKKILQKVSYRVIALNLWRLENDSFSNLQAEGINFNKLMDYLHICMYEK